MARPRRDGWDKLPLSHTRHYPPPQADEDEYSVAAGRRSSFSYLRLPEPILRLTVLKLDGSSFNVEVVRSASVLELKMEIENIFNKPAEEGGRIISWYHVWGYFCLCYNEHKLTDDEASLRTFGIKDGDQLQFIRHLSPIQNLNRRRSINRATKIEQHWVSLAKKHTVKEVKKDKEKYKKAFGPCPDAGEQSSNLCQKDSIVAYRQNQSKLDNLLQQRNAGPSPQKTKSKGQVAKICRNRKMINWAICY